MLTIDNNTQTFFEVAQGVWGMKDTFVNFYMIRDNTSGHWVLVDTGLKWSASKIKKMAVEIFGNVPPAAIILTHGHFDHVGSVKSLAKHWNIPVYAHAMEMPYLTGKSAYPPPDPSVGGGLMTSMSFLFPKSSINISEYLQELPADNSVPGMPEWNYIHTPGHAPGHISLFRQVDHLLIAGDAFVTTKSESALSTIFQRPVLSGPPKYFTYDWEQARKSLKSLMNLAPAVIATGHGKTMHGEDVLMELINLYNHFDIVAIPESGRYIPQPAITDATGTVWVPPAKKANKKALLQGLAIASITAAFVFYMSVRNKKHYPTINI